MNDDQLIAIMAAIMMPLFRQREATTEREDVRDSVDLARQLYTEARPR